MQLTYTIFRIIMRLKLLKQGFFKAIYMTIRHLYIVLLLILVGCQQMQATEQISAVDTEQPAAKPKQLDKQLKINRDALLQGPTEQMRLDAAILMLFDNEPNTRQILLDTLNQTENAEARSAVCKALKQARETNKHTNIVNKEAFVLPLITIIRDQNSEIAKLAAEATVIFDYQQICEPLEQMVSDNSLPVEARLNAVYALNLQRDIKAITKLINLLDDPEQQIAQAVEKAVQEAGIPVVKDPAARQKLIEELQNKGKEQFLRDWLIRQEAEMNRLQTEMQQLRQMYLSSLDKIYSFLSEDSARVEFLAEHLNGPRTIVKLWALDKISKWRVGTSSKLPAELGPILLNLISDQDRAVRLRTARLLSLMGQLSSAEKLLAQVKAEKDDEVRMEMFMALGAACQYAFAPDSGIKISPKIREETLGLASEYLSEDQPIKVQNGAEVIKKLLKQNGLPPALTESYLTQISKKYQQETFDDNDVALRAALLSTMADLCAQGAPVASSARKEYGSWFDEGLADESGSIREAAVNGLINIDKTTALRKLRENYINDASAQIRVKIIDLAREVGSEADLQWLSEKVKNQEENQSAWLSMLEIFRRSNLEVLVGWLDLIDLQKSGLSEEQLISFYKAAEQKAQTENRPQIIRKINEKLAVLYTKTANYELAAEYWGSLHQSAQSIEEQETYLGKLLGVYLGAQNIKSATDLIHNYLLDKDLDPNDLVIKTLNSFMIEPPAGADPNILLVEFERLDIQEARPKWAEQKEHWREMFIVANEPNLPREKGN
jgi:HEAT repeat protein